MWTQFWDMHSGGGQKEDWPIIYIEASEEQAKVIFYNRFGHNPERVTCTCCGPDYSISSDESLEQLTAYHRDCAFEGNAYVERSSESSWNPYRTIDEYRSSGEALFIVADDIDPSESLGTVPEQGFVWVD